MGSKNQKRTTNGSLRIVLIYVGQKRKNTSRFCCMKPAEGQTKPKPES